MGGSSASGLDGRGARADPVVKRPAAALDEDEARERSGFEAWERRLWAEGFPIVAGTDEAGRGPLAGPVVAAAFAVLTEDQEVRELLESVSDSKCMTEESREEAYLKLTHPRFEGRTSWAIAEASAADIDSMNILQASLLAMERSVRRLSSPPDTVLVDGCNRPPGLLLAGECWTRGSKKARGKDAEERRKPQEKLSKWFSCNKKQDNPQVTPDEPEVWRPRDVQAVIKGDGRVPSISAASVLAKVHRDRLMKKLDEVYPEYGFGSHKGYGTREHLEAIDAHGVCPQHRRSFNPVREALGLPKLDRVKPNTLDFSKATEDALSPEESTDQQSSVVPAVVADPSVEENSKSVPGPNQLGA